MCVWERWDFPHTTWIEAKSASVWVKVVNVTLMSATLARAGSVPCQCVMSPNEGELPVLLCSRLSPLMSFWINHCWFAHPHLLVHPPSLFSSPPQLSLHSNPSHSLVTLPHNEPSRTLNIPFPCPLSPNCDYLFVRQSAFAMFEDSDIQISSCLIVTVADVWSGDCVCVRKTEWCSLAFFLMTAPVI